MHDMTITIDVDTSQAERQLREVSQQLAGIRRGRWRRRLRWLSLHAAARRSHA